MNEKELFWLALGILIGYLAFEEYGSHKCRTSKLTYRNHTDSAMQHSQSEFPPTCGSCGG